MNSVNARLREIRTSLNNLAMVEVAIKQKKASLLAEWEDIAGPVAAEALKKFQLNMNMNIQPMDSKHEQRETIGTVGTD